MAASKFNRDVHKTVRKWRRILGLGSEWRIRVRVFEEPDGTDDDCKDAAAYIVVQPGYFKANLTVNAWNIGGPYRDLDHTIAHELTHALMQPVATMLESFAPAKMSEVTEQNLEALCERFSRAMVRLDRR